MKWDKKLWITADIFNKAVCANIPNPLKNLCTQFDVNGFVEKWPTYVWKL